MKINLTTLISFTSLMVYASAADAGVLADFYVGAMAGIGGQTMFADHHTKTDSSRMVGAIVGMDIPVVRIEGEYDYFDSKNLNTNAAMVNVYAKLPTAMIIPYIGAGVGVVFGGEQTFTDDAGIKTEYSVDTSTAYQAMLGTTIDILALPLKFDVEGRALYAADVYEVPGNDSKPDMLQYQLRAKMRYIF